MGRFCLFAYTGLTNRFRHARGLLQLSKSSQAHTIRKKQRVGFGKLFIGWRTKAIFFSKWNQNVGSALRKWNDKVKKNPRFRPLTSLVVGLRLKQNLISSLWFYLQWK